MNPTEPASFVQRLLRARARQTVDAVIPRALKHSEPERVDEEALEAFEDPVAFKRRFGFLWSITDRKRLLFFQSDHRLSNGQVRRLHAASALRPNAQGLRIQASRWEALLGLGHVVVLALVFGPLLVLGLIAYGPWLSLLQWIVLGLVGTSILSLAGAYYAFYVVPWRLRVRIEQEATTPVDLEIDP